MTATARELVVEDEPEALSGARHFVLGVLASMPQEVRDDAALVVTELVTNALLHAAPEVVLRVRVMGEGVRIEVSDGSRQVPLRVPASTGSMTGRGLGLVSALASAWGSIPTDDGKTVWAELSLEPLTSADDEADVDIDALLAGWADEARDEPLFTVELGAVPTDLLLEAKAHIDNLVREFILMRSGAGSGSEEKLPEQVAELVQTVVHGFADARTQIKQQAVAAAATGAPETTLRLVLPLSAAAAAESYLAALDEADRHARAARLLTLETPPAHRVFRHWYIETLVAQLRRAAAGKRPVPDETFPQRLAAELARLAPLQEIAARLTLLQQVTAALTAAGTVDDIVATVCESAHRVLGARTARVYLLDEDGSTLRSMAVAGGDPTLTHSYEAFSVDDDLPGAVVVRTGEPMVLRDSADIAERFPQLASIYRDEAALLVAPIAAAGRALGVLSLTFRGQEPVDEATQRAFLTTLADVTAQALDRAEVAHRAEEANERLAFLAEASVLLASSLDYRSVLEAVAGLVVPRLADWCLIQLLERGRLSSVALTHVDPAKVAWAREISARYPDDPDSPSGAANVIRTGVSELYPDLPDELLDAAAVDEEHRQLLHQVGMRSVLVVPLAGRTGVIGALTMIYAESGRRYREQDVSFVEDLAGRAAIAVETAHAFYEQSGRLARVMRVAEAAQHAILAVPPPVLGGTALSARYVSAAREALVGGDLYEVVRRDDAVRLLIGDVKGKGLGAVRIATVVLGEFRAAAADLADLSEVALQLDRRLRPYLGDEDFVTALVAEIRDDGIYSIVNCGHPAPLLAADGTVREVDGPVSLPLGLGASPELVSGKLTVGDRLLLYTDGIIEARTADGRFVDLTELTNSLADGVLDDILDGVLDALTAAVGAELGDDLALVVAEFRGLSGS